jgi:hypothetical protein
LGRNLATFLLFKLAKIKLANPNPPLSSASPVKLRLRVGPRALSEKKRIREQGVNKFLSPSVRNAPKENTLGVNKEGIMYMVRYFFGIYKFR